MYIYYSLLRIKRETKEFPRQVNTNYFHIPVPTLFSSASISLQLLQ